MKDKMGDYTIEVDLTRDLLLSKIGKSILIDRFAKKEETSPQQLFLRAACAYSDTEEMAQKMYDYISMGLFNLSTPAIVNAPKTSYNHAIQGTEHLKSLGIKIGAYPISCFIFNVEDNREDIVAHFGEIASTSSYGGGIGTNWSKIREIGARTSTGAKTSGVIPFLKISEAMMMGFGQGGIRKGSYSANLDIDHPEILEFLSIRKHSGGDISRKTLSLFHCVNLSDKFMEKVEALTNDKDADDTWELISPKSGKVVGIESVRKLWSLLLDTRSKTSGPFITYIDTMNRNKCQAYKNHDLQVDGTNLCTEITLQTPKGKTAVCCLSTRNLEHYDEWKDDDDFFYYTHRFLDNILSYFIKVAGENPSFEKSVKFSIEERSIGLCTLGFHSYLQSKNIPFECALARSINKNMYKNIQEKTNAVNLRLGKELGVPLLCKETGERNAHVTAVAPNATSGYIANSSPSVEPIAANIFTVKSLDGYNEYRNPYLEICLESYNKNTDEVWSDINHNRGSVSELDFFSDDEKAVFKTAMEIDQRWIVQHAADRQPFISQSQSINIFNKNGSTLRSYHDLHLMAWKEGVKTLYYSRGEESVQAYSGKSDKEASAIKPSDCLGCEA